MFVSFVFFMVKTIKSNSRFQRSFFEHSRKIYFHFHLSTEVASCLLYLFTLTRPFFPVKKLTRWKPPFQTLLGASIFSVRLKLLRAIRGIDGNDMLYSLLWRDTYQATRHTNPENPSARCLIWATIARGRKNDASPSIVPISPRSPTI